jgi:hypothetical protein
MTETALRRPAVNSHPGQGTPCRAPLPPNAPDRSSQPGATVGTFASQQRYSKSLSELGSEDPLDLPKNGDPDTVLSTSNLRKEWFKHLMHQCGDGPPL